VLFRIIIIPKIPAVLIFIVRWMSISIQWVAANFHLLPITTILINTTPAILTKKRF
jgi:hypothetical protein